MTALASAEGMDNLSTQDPSPASAGPALAPDELSTLTMVLLGIFLAVLIVMSIAGNVLVCVAIYTDRGLRSIGNLFLASLAIADLFVAALVMSFAAFNDLLGFWLFGPQLCDTWIAFDVMCSTASILNLCAISLDRYIHIKDPLRYGRWVTRRIAMASIGCVWMLAGLISFLPISLGLHRPDAPQPVIDGKPTCAVEFAPTYAVVSSCISFYVPCVVMLGIYCRLYCYAQKHVKNIRAVTRPLAAQAAAGGGARVGVGGGPSLPLHLHAHSTPYHVSDHKAAITVGVIMGVFLVCWVPFFVINIVAAYCKDCIPSSAFKVLTWLGYSNSAFNPVIYSIFNKEFRYAFRRILTARCGGYESVSMRAGAYLDRKRPTPSKMVSSASINSNQKASFAAVTPPRGSAPGLGGLCATKHNGSCTHLRDYTPRSSVGSIRQTRVNSSDKLEEVAI
ncbi:dopamine receptor 1-like [Thrips palmi]|uniref:Dopamine receptor 1-like n=1 Tax=Thrips palmi TaxID=161013 RepID=A0A6P9AIW9_THRPL|nr:dopamine receptor 1-like [Thrips palmi]